MSEAYESVLEANLDEENHRKLMAICNPDMHRFVADAVELCDPAFVFVCTDSTEDIGYIRKKAIEVGEEKPLAIEGHTIHFDGPRDLGRDRQVTRYLVPRGTR
jgi:phosphoenolpyruvate carboxykinase (GTP)